MNDTPTLRLDSDAAFAEQAGRLLREAERDPTRRFILGIAGIPGSGKSTLAQRVVDCVNRLQPDAAELMSMDGFHLTNAELDRQGWRDRKGAAHTFDAEGYIALLGRYAERANVGPFPEYSRAVHEPVASDRQITERTRLIVTEGNYLLLNESPWSGLAEVLDEAWWLEVPVDVARTRLGQRDLSLGRTQQIIDEKYERNDGVNTEYIIGCRREADRVVEVG